MRKIERLLLNSIETWRSFSSGNTSFNAEEGKVFLHGNHIATIDRNTREVIYASNCGWNTNLTRSRLRVLGVDLRANQRFVNSVH